MPRNQVVIVVGGVDVAGLDVDVVGAEFPLKN